MTNKKYNATPIIAREMAMENASEKIKNDVDDAIAKELNLL